MIERFVTKPQVEVTASLRINEVEMRALDALVGYGADSFLKVFYEKLGEAYMKPHEAGLRSLFATISSEVPAILHKADQARDAFVGAKSAV